MARSFRSHSSMASTFPCAGFPRRLSRWGAAPGLGHLHIICQRQVSGRGPRPVRDVGVHSWPRTASRRGVGLLLTSGRKSGGRSVPGVKRTVPVDSRTVTFAPVGRRWHFVVVLGIWRSRDGVPAPVAADADRSGADGLEVFSTPKLPPALGGDALHLPTLPGADSVLRQLCA